MLDLAAIKCLKMFQWLCKHLILIVFCKKQLVINVYKILHCINIFCTLHITEASKKQLTLNACMGLDKFNWGAFQINPLCSALHSKPQHPSATFHSCSSFCSCHSFGSSQIYQKQFFFFLNMCY